MFLFQAEELHREYVPWAFGEFVRSWSQRVQHAWWEVRSPPQKFRTGDCGSTHFAHVLPRYLFVIYTYIYILYCYLLLLSYFCLNVGLGCYLLGAKKASAWLFHLHLLFVRHRICSQTFTCFCCSLFSRWFIKHSSLLYLLRLWLDIEY